MDENVKERILSGPHRKNQELLLYIDALQLQDTLSGPSLPSLGDFGAHLSETERISRIQKFIDSFEYNYTGKPFVQYTKNGGFTNIVHSAKEFMRVALPIQCVEAVFIGGYLSAGIQTVDRVPISFKTRMGDSIHRHIVLAMRYNNKWGSIGISRRPNLMNKELQFESLKELLDDFRLSYHSCLHRVLTVYVGLPFPHDIYCTQGVKWRALRIKMHPYDSDGMAAKLASYTDNMSGLFDYFLTYGHMPPENMVPIKQVPQYQLPLGRRRQRSRSSSIGNESVMDRKVVK
mmetsp:Transcript_18396/g.18482  ORF Transcript_18396/g.18482 Transcript_18396/m.18482 type:complete len:289 (+) Transcript_18396:130-996(+)|eukprot:CAMPEP_0182430914 /NCGR_PEP_ID=MMETSP1167-20130531/44731_1 /TAXON_ID=2988 /ORGANISM="Mallomonas Sp, Strain CCMP3275" /LENGTH=288 /DNA_ID=CAMNT_0024616595 /DNA_START=116 /DNA_END=982 /DNA_ORIENTATION=+